MTMPTFPFFRIAGLIHALQGVMILVKWLPEIAPLLLISLFILPLFILWTIGLVYVGIRMAMLKIKWPDPAVGMSILVLLFIIPSIINYYNLPPNLPDWLAANFERKMWFEMGLLFANVYILSAMFFLRRPPISKSDKRRSPDSGTKPDQPNDRLLD